MAIIKVIHGPNFSGRSDVLRTAVIRERNDCGRAVAFIGPDTFSSFSGLAARVSDEASLYGSAWIQLGTQFGISHLGQRELSTLSGGEEAICAIAVAAAIGTRLVVIDCAMEQLDADRRDMLLRSLIETEAEEILVADNRFGEWSSSVPLEEYSMAAGNSELPTGNIRGDVKFPCPRFIPEAIRLSDVRHRYTPGALILDGVNLALTPGTILHLAGANGSGKSTLAKILVGAILPSSGRIHVSGMPNAQKSGRSRFWGDTAENGLRRFWDEPGKIFSFHFQHPDAQLFCASVLDELTVGARREDRTATCVEHLVNAATTAFGLEHVLRTHPHDLPFALRKRVALAATFTCGTPWIILDEPTLGQDDTSVTELVSLIRQTAEIGVGFIVISHCVRFIEQLQPRRLLLQGGKLIASED